MAKKRVIIASSRILPGASPGDGSLLDEVEVVQKNTLEELKETLSRETAHLVVLDGVGGGSDVERFLEEISATAPRTPVIYVVKGEVEDFAGILPNKFRGEVVREEDFARTFPELVEKYVFSGFGALFDYEMEELFSYCFPVITTLDYDPLCQTVLDFFKEILSADLGLLISEQPGRGSGFRLLAATGFDSAAEVVPFFDAAGKTIVEKCGKDPAIWSLEEFFGSDVRSFFNEAYKTVFSCRFEMEGMTPVYCLVFLKGAPIPEIAYSKTIKFLYQQATYALYNAEKSIKVQSLIYIDDLTKLYNARYLNVVLDRELKRSDRYGVPVSILFLDIDYFKRVNDTFGHLIGSRVLCEFGKIIRSCVRETDTVVRYGGDEFVVILVETNPDQAMLAAERMRKTVENHVFMKDEGYELTLTVSIGIATYPIHASNKEELLQMADRAMYRGKDSTRNVVYIAES